MRYLITGGAGFIGSHLADSLLADGNSVTILDDFSTGSFLNIAHLDEHPALEIITGDVKDTRLVEDYVKMSDAVFHLASAVGVQLVVERPVHTIDTIVHGTATVMSACSRYRRPVLLTSTSEVYGKASKVPFSEEDDSVTGPPSRRRWCYACAKALDEFLALAYWHESHLPVTVVRLFNTVGPRQTGQYGMVIPNFIKQALHGKPIRVFGSGEQCRCFCHVADVVRGLRGLMETPASRGEMFNIGSQSEVSILELAEKIREATGSSSEIVKIPYSEAYGEGFEDMQRRVPDISKVNQAIGFAPKKSLDEIISDCIDFAKSDVR